MRAVYKEPSIQIIVLDDVSIIVTSTGELASGGQYTDSSGNSGDLNWGDLKGTNQGLEKKKDEKERCKNEEEKF